MTAFVVAILAKATAVTMTALGCTRLARGTRAAVRHLALAAAFTVLLLLPVASWLGPSLGVEIPIAVSRGLVDPLPDGVLEVTATGSLHTADTGATVPAARSPLRG